jgi:hypothetical protein
VAPYLVPPLYGCGIVHPLCTLQEQPEQGRGRERGQPGALDELPILLQLAAPLSPELPLHAPDLGGEPLLPFR